MTDRTSFHNPVLPGFYPDPSVCRVGDDFFLATSTFTYFPGVPIFHSTNLVDWTQLGHALDRTTQLDLMDTRGSLSEGIFAPTLRFHDGRFWMITTNATDSGGTAFFVTATDPAGPWSDPVPVDIKGIDPDIAWDERGACWVHFSTAFSVDRVGIDDETGKVLEGPVTTWSGTGLQYPEAPHLFRRDDTWYLMIAEGGTEAGHGVSIARGPSPVGPWETCPANPIISHRSTSRPIQNTGHADFVEAPDGSWWMVLLGTRPAGSSPGFHVLGRETFLVPVDWVDGWPVAGELLPEMPRRPPGPVDVADVVGVAARDDFASANLDPRWIGVRRSPRVFSSLADRPGWLTVRGEAETLDDFYPAMVSRRQQHHRCVVRAAVDLPAVGEAGLAVYMDEKHHCEIGVRENSIVVSARIGPVRNTLAEGPRPPGTVVLRIEAKPGGQEPDRLAFGFEDGAGMVVALAEIDGRYFSTQVATGFTGRVIGMYAVGCTAAFDWFEYQPSKSR
jgi:xylan 1,4-beta-xylosidase